MSKKILSIIIPVYNLKMYVEETVSSIYKQNVPHHLFETIIIDDGSCDGTNIILGELDKKYDNLTVIYSKHRGVSAVRNIGIRNSMADYIMFLDGDDFLVCDSLSSVIDAIIKETVDCIIGRSYVFPTHKEIYVWNELLMADTIYDGMALLESGYMRGSIWGLVISREFVNKKKLSFLEGARNGEDSIFFLMTCLNNVKVVFKDVNIVHKRQRIESASSRWTLSRILHYKICIDYLASQKLAFGSASEKKHIDKMIYLMMSMIIHGFTVQGIFPPRRIFKIIEVDKILPLQTSTGVVKQWKMVVLNKSLFAFVLLSWFLNRVRLWHSV